MVNALRINPADNVAVALMDLAAGTTLVLDAADLPPIVTTAAIPFGHKIALAPIASGETVIKYGASIGRASGDIATGDHVHNHNLVSVRGAVAS